MNLYKRIISLFLVFAICISSMVTVAFAADDRAVASGFTPADFSSAVSYGAAIDENFGFLSNAVGYLGTLREAMATGSCDGCMVNPDGRHNFLPSEVLTTSWAAALKGSEACICRYCGITYNDFYDETYNAYLSDLQTDLGGTVLTNGAIRYYFTSQGMHNPSTWDPIPSSHGQITTINEWLVPSSEVRIRISYAYLPTEDGVVVAPANGTYSTGYIAPGLEFYPTAVLINDRNVEAGGVMYPSALPSNPATSGNMYLYFLAKNMANVFLSTSIIAYADFTPLNGISSLTGQDITINSRPTSIVGNYGIVGDDGTIIKVDGNMIVDESTNVVYNPVTNNTYNYTDYAFDYSDRSYNLTLEDGSTLKVVYGDENVTIQEGDTIYNIYYLIPDDSGSGGGSDSGDTPSGEDMSWWKQAWTNFTDKLFSILGNGGSSVNPDTAPAVPDDEETGEKGYSVIDLFVVLKDGTWAFITGIVSTAYDGFTGFVESVSSAGSFFTFYDEESEDGILFVPLEGGETIWD